MRFTVLILLTVFAGAGLGSPHLSWVSQTAGLDIRLSVEEVAIDSVQVEGRGFATVNLPEAGFTLEIGKPLVPVYYRLVEVPFGAELDIEASCEEVEERSLGLPLLPRQEPVPKSGPRPSFVMDEKVYRADEFSPDIGARILEIGEIRGHRVATVEIRPVSYNPVKGVLRFSRKMVVKVRWAGADWERTRVMHRRYDSPAYQGRLRGIVLNAESFEEDMVPPLPIGLLIIVPDEWQANVQPLADWYRRKGFHVFVRNLTQVGGGQANTVKDYIQDAYDHWPVPPDFVLLVGDVDRIGYFTGQGQGNPPTDLNFSLVAGSDYFPDIDVSRLSVATASQLDSLVVKTVNYQKNIWSNGTQWCRKAYFIASSDGGNHQVAEGTHLYCMRKIRPMGVVCDSLWLYYGTGTPITTALNTGRAWVTYSGHGGENCWADPSPDFDIGAVHALANTDMVPFVQTYACLSGNFASTSYPECFSEAWIRNGFRGGIAHLASTVTSYWTEDDTLQRRVYDYMFDSLWTWIMGGVNRAKLKYYEQMGNNSTTRRYFEMYNLMGDGAVDPYWQEPQPLTVTHPPVIPIGSYQLRVLVEALGRPIENALVGVTAKSDSLVFASGYTNSSGEAVLEVTTTQPDSIFITVTGHNLAPYLGAAMALPPSGPYVMFLRHLVDDSAGGNNDHIINPGETINLPIWMKNWGNETAQNVQVWLSTTDTNIALIDTVKSFGSIMAQDSAWTGPDGFRFAVAPSCTNGYNLRFTLTARDANDSVWTSFPTLSVGAPVLQFVSCRAIDSPPGGNGNGMIEPGEVGDVIVTLRNIGLGNGYEVTGILRSGDPRLSVLDSLASFGTIPRDTTGSNEADRFQVRADASIPRETQVPCTLVVSTEGRTWLRVFELAIGVIRSCDPVPDGPRTPALYWAYEDVDTFYNERPQFNWVEINTVGTRLTLGDDETQQISLPSGFGPFVYYGQSYNQLSICSNGFVAPGATTFSDWNNVALPKGSAPPMLALNWDDIYPLAGNGVWYYHDAANHRFIVEWDSVAYYSQRTVFDKYQVILYDTTLAAADGNCEFVYQYLRIDQNNSCTVGSQDQTYAIGINALFDGSYHRGSSPLVAGRAIKFTTDPPTGISESEASAGPVPKRLALLGSAPNPFRGKTTVFYAVPVETRLSLGVFDAAGRKVAELFSGRAKPGVHSAAWNGLDDKGRAVAQGVYFYRLDGAGTRLVKKTVLLE